MRSLATPKLRVLGYTRVSQVKGRSGDTFISPERQRELVEDWARRNQAELVDVLYEGDESGGRVDRPLLNWAVEQIEGPKSGIDGLVVPKVDRFFRQQLGGHEMIRRIRDAKGFLVMAGGTVDSRTPEGRMMLGFMLTIAEHEYDNYKDNFTDARMRAVARGVHPCANTPVGYRRRQVGVTVNGNPKWTGPLFVDPDTGPLVRQMIERAADGEAWRSIARWAESVGLRTALGHPHWTARAVKEVVRNHVYKGVAFHGPFVNENAHEALVDDDTWRRAQRPGALNPPRGRDPAMLSGILRCAGCSHNAQPDLDAGKRRRYSCRRRFPGGICPDPTSLSTARGVHEWVEQRFFEAVGEIAAEQVTDDGDLPDLEQAVGNAKVAFERFRDMDPALLAGVTDEEWAAGLQKRKRDLVAAEAARDAELDRLRGPLPIPVADLRETWPDLSVVEKRKLLSMAFDCVFMFPGTRHDPLEKRLHVCLKGEGPAGLAGKHTSGRAAVPPRKFVRPEAS